jgi:hypothetical protein
MTEDEAAGAKIIFRLKDRQQSVGFGSKAFFS